MVKGNMKVSISRGDSLNVINMETYDCLQLPQGYDFMLENVSLSQAAVCYFYRDVEPSSSIAE